MTNKINHNCSSNWHERGCYIIYRTIRDKKYNQRPEVITRKEKYAEDNKERMKEKRDKYNQQPGMREKQAENRKEYRDKPESKRMQRDRDLQRHYGITIEDKERMFKEQDGKCDVCKKPFERICGTNKKKGDCHVDHDHVSGRVRALLCRSCNLTLSVPNRVLKELIKYKEHHQILDLMNGNDYDA